MFIYILQPASPLCQSKINHIVLNPNFVSAWWGGGKACQ